MAHRVRALVAVEPPALLRLIEYLIADVPEIQIVSSLREPFHLAQQAKRLQPDLILVNVRMLGLNGCEMLAQVKRAAPDSNVILMDFDTGYVCPNLQCRADLYLPEEAMVKRLVSSVWQVVGRRPVQRRSSQARRRKS